MKKLFILVTGLLLTFSSCQDNLIGEWNYNKVVETDEQKTASYFSDDFFNSGAIFGGNGNFLLIDDGSANPFNLTLINDDENWVYRNTKNKVIYGTWSREKGNKIKLNILSDLKQYDVVIEELKNNDKQLQFKLGSTEFNPKLETLAFYYTKDSDVDISKSRHSYLSSELNSWRIPAQESEGYKAVNNRVKQSLEFALMYYKYCDKNNIPLSLKYLRPIPLQFGSNGIITYRNADWEALFFDDEQAQMSYKILNDAFRGSSRIPKNLKSSFEIGIYALEQLIANLEE